MIHGVSTTMISVPSTIIYLIVFQRFLVLLEHCLEFLRNVGAAVFQKCSHDKST